MTLTAPVRRILLLGAAVACLGLLGACAGDDDTGAVFLDMRDNFFTREVTRVPVGAGVVFRNAGISPHNAIAVDGSWSTVDALRRDDMQPGDETTITMDEEGVYRFFCSFHGTEAGDGMAAVLVVGDARFSATEEERAQLVVSEASGRTLVVDPARTATAPGGPRYATIQRAVDAARPGDLVLVTPGTYEEEVTVDVPSVTIRGTDRNEVIIDGRFERANGIQVFADGVVLENMTARDHILNGFFWSGVEGYRGSYLTAVNNADYGIYAFDSVDGVFEHSYASGSPDSGFYIGQCYPCRAIINGVIAVGNSLGYSGTNAGGDLYIVNSAWFHNRAGIVPNTLDSELLPPQRDTVIAGNFIWANDQTGPVAKEGTFAAYGNGVVLAGGVGNHVHHNFITDHRKHGVLVTPNLDENFWFSSGNVIRDNVIRRSGVADLALAGPAGEGNCFEDNTFGISAPFGLEMLHGCRGLRLPLGWDVSSSMRTIGLQAEGPDGPVPMDEVAAQPVEPLDHPDLPGGRGAPVRPAVDVFAGYGLDASQVGFPERKTLVSYDIDDEGVAVETLAGSGPNAFQLVFNLYGYLLPFVLYAAWTSLAFWDLARREQASKASKLAWIAAILLVPFVGVIAYHALGRSSIPGWLRAAVVGGGLIAYLLVLGVASLAGGII
ncbi:MAG TPA: PLDc N-terminal domain-containing protein [Actinomycetota bacterium]|nr:PLDc N-terminal domain-containing protein [Actinomycetota bacterium]